MQFNLEVWLDRHCTSPNICSAVYCKVHSWCMYFLKYLWAWQT